METLASLRKEPTFRAAIIAPIAIVLIFVFFNMPSQVSQTDAAAAMTLGVVNLDEGAPGPFGTIKISEQILSNMGPQLPIGTAPYASEADGVSALDQGAASMLLIVPLEFSAKAMAGEPTGVRIINTHHLSIAEAQFGASLAGQFQANMSLAVTLVRQALARGVPPNPAAPLPVSAEVRTLHAAANDRVLFAPFVLMFPLWLSALVGAIMMHLISRKFVNRSSMMAVAIVRTVLPIATVGIATLLAILVVGFSAGVWAGFFAPWFYLWLVGVAAAWLFVGLFSVFSFVAIVVALPLAFYQGTIAGVIAPAAAAPGWLAWVAGILPLDDLMFGMRAILIGGPDGAVPSGAVFVLLLVGLALIWGGTTAHAMRGAKSEAAA